jgi:hypothetical protein
MCDDDVVYQHDRISIFYTVDRTRNMVTLHKHGDPEKVEAKFNAYQKMIAAMPDLFVDEEAFCVEVATDVLDDLNRVIECSALPVKYFERLTRAPALEGILVS